MVSLAEKRAELRAEGVVASPEPDRSYDDDFGLGDLDAFRSKSPVDEQVDTALAGITIIDAYNRWCGKMAPKVGKKRESIMCSCPFPGHEDKHPSAWLNLDLDVGNCALCGGFDVFNIAGWHFNLDPKQDFVELRQAMAAEYGVVVSKTRSGRTFIEHVGDDAPEIATVESETPQTASGESSGPENGGADWTSDEPDPTVAPTQLHAVKVLINDFGVPAIDWRSIAKPGTFLHEWMTICSTSDLPDEYYFWQGMMALGLAAGREAVLLDDPSVRSNLFVCLYGPSGIGKTRSTRPLRELLERALPYEHTDPESSGIYVTPIPGSAEALVDIFSKPIRDEEDPKIIKYYAGVRGLVIFDELASLMGKSNRAGSVLKPKLIELFDGYDTAAERSRGHGEVRAEKYFCSSLTTTQPGAVRELLDQGSVNSGFANRWIFAMGPMKKLRSYGGAPLDVTPCVKLIQQVRQWCFLGRKFHLEGEAFEVWDQFFTDRVEATRLIEEQSLVQRIELILKKIMVLLCANEHMTQPDADLVRRACSLFSYLETSYGLVLNEINKGTIDDCRATITEYIDTFEKKNSKPPTWRELDRALPKRFQRELVNRVMKLMEDFGEVRRYDAPNKAGGRRTVRWGSAG